ncbi:MAG: hypothetical protein K0U98_27975 [Deltaproteobacteria bacterium]|nr:hypothetical protein [Deltaproteobacteria bacterium]
MNRLEPVLLAFFFACWLAVLLPVLGLSPLSGSLFLEPRSLYMIAVATGWLSGNLYLRRRQQVPQTLRWRFLVAYLLGPPGLFFLLWAMGPEITQAQAPLVPLYAVGVSSILFLVPIVLRRWPG